ncbi:hypothetical protein GCM10007416_00810 [Kroppenstedtia guangzhouensis]|uniref:Uncharacterized protein n=1 Tax=Kroppenstedtia guangzhouensis TaxID=1274356 RepID=A0ABQ1FXJ4_9BACL|nr:hypothetical protein [Kroppenstedtia guangzhouensis]GGA32078.1 hypothetical protein GCM10007416_00810 [Kroppenstedtia guangzhouensis]
MEKPFEVVKRETVESISQVLEDSKLPPGILVMILEKMAGFLRQQEQVIVDKWDRESAEKIVEGKSLDQEVS